MLLEMENGVLVNVEVFMNSQYGYDVRAELVCEKGTLELVAPRDVTQRRSAQESFGFPSDWRPRFAAAYRAELQAWIGALGSGKPVGASAWDGYAAAVVTAAALESQASGKPISVELGPRPALYS